MAMTPEQLSELRALLGKASAKPHSIGEEAFKQAAGVDLATRKILKALPNLLDTIEAQAATIEAQAARIGVLSEALKHTADCLSFELQDRDVSDAIAEDDIISWLGKEYGRQTIAALIRLRQARAALNAASDGEEGKP